MKMKLTLCKDGKRYAYNVKAKDDEAVTMLTDAIFESKYEAYIERQDIKKGKRKSGENEISMEK